MNDNDPFASDLVDPESDLSQGETSVLEEESDGNDASGQDPSDAEDVPVLTEVAQRKSVAPLWLILLGGITLAVVVAGAITVLEMHRQAPRGGLTPVVRRTAPHRAIRSAAPSAPISVASVPVNGATPALGLPPVQPSAPATPMVVPGGTPSGSLAQAGIPPVAPAPAAPAPAPVPGVTAMPAPAPPPVAGVPVTPSVPQESPIASSTGQADVSVTSSEFARILHVLQAIRGILVAENNAVKAEVRLRQELYDAYRRLRAMQATNLRLLHEIMTLRAAAPAAPAAAPAPSPLWRGWRLVGVSDNALVLRDQAGTVRILRPGQSLRGVRIDAIEAGRRQVITGLGAFALPSR